MNKDVLIERTHNIIKTIIVWAGVLLLFYIMPFGFHVRLGKDTADLKIEFKIGKGENTLKIFSKEDDPFNY